MEDMSGNIVSVRAIRRIEGPPVKEADCPGLRGFRRKPAEECTEPRVD